MPLFSGLFFEPTFGISAGALGMLADHFGIEAVYAVRAYAPAIEFLAALLPNIMHHDREA